MSDGATGPSHPIAWAAGTSDTTTNLLQASAPAPHLTALSGSLLGGGQDAFWLAKEKKLLIRTTRRRDARAEAVGNARPKSGMLAQA